MQAEGPQDGVATGHDDHDDHDDHDSMASTEGAAAGGSGRTPDGIGQSGSTTLADPLADPLDGDDGPLSGASDHDAPDIAADIARAKVRQRLFGGDRAVTSIDRFQLLESIGKGGMGMVFAAYDPRLDRRVAIKIVLVRRDRPVQEARQRLLQEAQLMAQLAHPNVVTVHEAGPYEAGPGDEGIYVAMEYVRGQTLAAWLEQRRRHWSEVVRVFVEAGRGLEAAHRAGIIHRDFKPDNVMIDEDGRARVLDFGLAKTLDMPSNEMVTLESLDDAELSSRRLAQLTRTGALMGTPRYMPPERFRGAAPDAGADQYAFCVSMWNALCGVHPFERETLRAMHEAMRSDEPELPAGLRVPAWVLQVLRRGLASQPDRRWPSMTALLQALERDPARLRRRRQLVGGLVVLGLGFAAGAVALRPDPPPPMIAEPDPVCTGGPAQRDEVWGPSQRAAARAAFLGTTLSHASSTWARVEPALDRYADAWVEAHRDACEATELRHEQTPAQLERRMACLHHDWRALGSLVEAFAHADAEVVDKADDALEQLPSIDRCSDLLLLSTEVAPPPAEIAERVRQQRDELTRAHVLATVGRHAESLERSKRALAEATELDYRPLLARAQYVLGDVEATVDGAVTAEPLLIDAFVDASATGVGDVASLAASRLAYLVGVPLRREREALLWARLACVEADRHHDDEARARCWTSLADAQVLAQDYETAIEGYREALAYYERTQGPDAVAVAQTRRSLGNALRRARRFDEAVPELERAIEIFGHARGTDHPSVALSHGILARLLWHMGRSEDALVHAERALSLFERRMGPEHLNVGNAHYLLGNVLSALGRKEEAVDHLRRAREIKAEHFGTEDNVNVALVDHDLASTLMTLDRHAEADAILARVYETLSHSDSAMRRHAATALLSRGRAALAMGRTEDAVAFGEQGLAEAETHALELEHIVTARDWMARAMGDLGGRRAESIAMAEQAVADYQSLGERFEPQRRELEQWLAQARGPAPR